MNSKLERQLAELLAAEVITSDTAQKITAFYHTQDKAKPNRLLTIFGVLGALLSGLGIILIIAHNWDDMPKTMKTFLAFLPLILGQVACAFSVIKKKNTSWIEASTTFLILAVGATISLVSQVYNIPGNMSSFLLVWAAVTAPLIYLMRSNMAIILQLVLATWFAFDFGYLDSRHTPWWYLVLFAFTVPYYIQLLKEQPRSNIAGVLNWLMPLSLVISAGAFIKADTLAFLLYIGLFGLFYNIGQLPLFKNQKLRRNGLTIMGSLGTIFLLTMLTFEWFWKDARNEVYDALELSTTFIIFALGVAVLVYSHWKKIIQRFNLFQYAFLIVGFLYLTKGIGIELMLISMNILVAALGLFAIHMGAKKGSYGILNYGLLIITVLITCRFFDTKLDFIFRGILFIAVGIGFFFANYYLLKKQKKQVSNTISNAQNHD